jgi:HEAT repeats
MIDLSMKIKVGIAVFFLFGALASARDRVSDIEFYGYKGMDIDAVRKRLPVHEGDVYTVATDRQVRQAVKRITGREPTYVGAVCCDENGDNVFFIGLAGESSASFTYNPEPKGMLQLSTKLAGLDRQLQAAVEAAVQKGGDGAQEDDSNGYALFKDPAAHSVQLAMREYSVQHQDELLRVLKSSSDSEQRAIAANALGYARQSPEQVAALVWASRDSEETVRNNAVRALAVLASSSAEVARKIPVESFIAMLHSGIWTDRNKASMLLSAMTGTRDPEMLTQLRAQALDPLIEMAQWRDTSHAIFARIVLARIAGIPEERLMQAVAGPVQAILDQLNH